MSTQPKNRNEQRAARALQREHGISYMQALAQVRAAKEFDSDHRRGQVTPMPVDSISYIPVERRFLYVLLDDLRHHGAAGAAREVWRTRAADVFTDGTTMTKERDDLVRLTDHALQAWGMAGLHRIEEGALAALASAWLPLTSAGQAVAAEQLVGGWRTTLRSRPDPHPPRLPVRRDTVVAVLAQLQLALRALNRLDDPDPFSDEWHTPASAAAEALGRALSHAFRGGIITALPPATRAALVAVRSG